MPKDTSPKDEVFAAHQAMTEFSKMIHDAASRGYEAMEASLSAWSAETRRFQAELSDQSRSMAEQLRACQSPLDLLSVEQAWVAARSRACMESGLRLTQALGAIAQAQADGSHSTDTAK